MADLTAQMVFTADASGVEAGVGRAQRSLANLGVTAATEGKKAAAGIAAIGDGTDRAAAKVDAGTKTLIGSIQRATAAAEAGARGTAQYYEAIAAQKGVDVAPLRPFLDQLDAVRLKQDAAAEAARREAQAQKEAAAALSGRTAFIDNLSSQVNAIGKTRSELLALQAAQLGVSDKAAPMIARLRETETGVGKVGVSAGQTRAALAQLPAQFSDIVVSLQDGQKPLTVFLQQGSQIKDSFGGAGPAVQALGSYVLGLISPVTIAAAALGVLALAYYKGSQESRAYTASLILSGNAAGTTASQMADMAASISKANGAITQGAAASSLATLAKSGAVGADSLERYAAAAANFERVAGQSVEKTAEAFKDLQKEPLDAAVKLDEKIHFLTLTTYEHIKSLTDQGKATEAARVAQNAYADALDSRSKSLSANIGLIERAWLNVSGAAKSAWDAMLGVGRSQSGSEQLASLKQQLADRTARGPLNSVPGVAGAFEKGNDALRAQINYIERVNEQLGKQAQVQGAATKQVQARAEWDKEGDKYLSNREKREQAIAKVRAEGAAAGVSEADIQQRIKDITDKLKDPKGAAIKDDSGTKMLESLRQAEASLQSQLDGELKITDTQKKQVEFQQLIADLKGKKILTAEQQSLLANKDAITAQLAKNVALSDQIEFEKKIAEIVKKSAEDAKQFRQQMEAINVSIASGQVSRDEQSDRSLGAFGLGDRARQEVEAQKSIRAEFQRYQDAATKDAGKTDQLGSKEYQDEVARIKEALDKALAAQTAYFDALRSKQADWKNGATTALANYVDAINNVSASADKAVTDAFKGGEDALVSFVTTGKLSFTGLANSIISDLARIAIQQTITKPLAEGLLGILKGDTGTAPTTGKGIIEITTGLKPDWGKLYGTVGGLIGGFRAEGGPVDAGTPYMVGERGKEMFVPSVPGNIVPNNALGGGGSTSVSIVNHWSVGDIATASDLRTAVANSEKRIAGQIGRSKNYGGTLA